MIRSIIVLAMAASLAGGVWAAGHGYYVIVLPGSAGQPGDSCIADGVGSGQETKTSDGRSVLAKSVHGANTTRCPNPLFPNLATTEKIAPDEVRNAPSTQCIGRGTKVGDELTLPAYGRAVVLELHAPSAHCSGDPEATVIGAAAYRASQAASAPALAAAPPAPQRGPTQAQIQQEYDRLVAAAAPVKEYHVRHILVRTREDAQSALLRIKLGEPFGKVASDISTDSGSRVVGGDLGWNVPASFIKEFSQTMVSLDPAGLAPEPTHTRFGWHVIELLEVKTGKDSFPSLASVRDRIVARLEKEPSGLVRVGAKAVCRKMVAPEMPAAASSEHIKGTVLAEMRVENGKVSEILSLSGPDIFHKAVTEAVNKYECDHLDRAVIATQSFDF